VIPGYLNSIFLIDVSLTFSMITPFYLIPGKESLSDAIGMERKLVKQKQKPYFEINLSHIQTFQSEGTAAVSWPVVSPHIADFLMLY